MIPSLRQQYNERFDPHRYAAMLDDIADTYHHRAPFRIAETPVFIDAQLKGRLLQAVEDITAVVTHPNFRERSASALLPGQVVPHETPHTTFLQMDFGLCLDADGSVTPASR